MVLVAGTPELVRAHAYLRSRLLENDRFRSIFPAMAARPLRHGQRFDNGSALVEMVAGRDVGPGADIVVIDDPMSAEHALVDWRRAKTNDWFMETIGRLSSIGRTLVGMKRLHDDDLIGQLLKERREFRWLSFPAVINYHENWTLPHGQTYTRARGEVLMPHRESREQLRALLHTIGAWQFSAHYLQSPLTCSPRQTHRSAYSPARGGHWQRPLELDVLGFNFGEETFA